MNFSNGTSSDLLDHVHRNGAGSQYPGRITGNVQNGGTGTALEETGIQDQVHGLDQFMGQIRDAAAAGGTGQVGTGAGDGTADRPDQGPGNGVSGYPDPDFAGAGGEKAADTGIGIEYQGQASWPQGLHQLLGRLRHLCHQGFQIGGMVNQNQEGVGVRPAFNLKDFLDGFRISGICGQAIQAPGGKDDHSLIFDDFRSLGDGIR